MLHLQMLITSQTRVKRVSRIHHRTILRRMVRWCIRLTRLTLVCEVIRYRLVQVRQNQKKTFRVGGPQSPFSISSSFILSFVFNTSFLSQYKNKTFSFCVVWWKKTIRSTSHTIRYSNSMMLYIHAHSSKIWANFNAFLRWSSGSLQRASLVTENQTPLYLLLKSPNVDSAEGNEVLLW